MPNTIIFGGFPIKRGALEPHTDEHFVQTPTTARRLDALARVCMTRRYPILLEGPMPSGKTLLVEFIAATTGTACLINNHEQTDVQEYLGSYIQGANGSLVFRERAR